jgi:ATP-dependent Lhr-like helicase
VLTSRVDGYEPAMLDLLCLTGEVAWARLSTGPTQVVGATPIALFRREHADAWLDAATVRPRTDTDATPPITVSDVSRTVVDRLRSHGASFAGDLAASCGLTDEQLRAALAELVSLGAISSDGFAGLRAIIGAASATATGRWFALGVGAHPPASAPGPRTVETLAWTLLRRYGVVFRRVLAREPAGVPWRDLAQVYRRLEARGEIRGGRFVSGMSGEQFALPEAIERLREARRNGSDDRLITISAADPLNLTGAVTVGDRVRASAGNRIVYRNGVPVAAMEGDMLRMLEAVDAAIAPDVAAAAAGRRVPVLSGYVGRITSG